MVTKPRYKSEVEKIKDSSVFDLFDFDDPFIEENLHKYIKTADYYLVYLRGCRWNGSSGYRVVNNIKDAFYRGYDCNIYLEKSSNKGKILQCREYHHDVPTGHSSYIVALSKDEHSKLESKSIFNVFDYIENLLISKGVSL